MLPDWQDIENRLYEESKAGILRFAAEHPEVVCSFFAYDTNPIYGEFLLCFDTLENALTVAQQNEREAIQQRKKMLTLREAWRGAKYFSTHPAVTEYSPNVGLFAYHMYASIPMRELDELSASGDYPKGLQTDDDYIEGNACIGLWKVIDMSSFLASRLRK